MTNLPGCDEPYKEMASPVIPVRAAARRIELLAEDGVLIFLDRLLSLPLRRVRDALFAAKFNAPGLRIGSRPKLRGLRHITIGRDFSAGDLVWIEAVTHYLGQSFDPKIDIGNNVVMSSQIHIGAVSSITIGGGTLIGSRVTLIDHNHGVYSGPFQSPPEQAPALRPLSRGAPISIGQNVWVGDGAVILPGAKIGAGSIIGANSVVTGSIPESCIAVGAPARPIRRYLHDRKEWSVWTPET